MVGSVFMVFLKLTYKKRSYLYPAIFALIYSTLTFPGGLGKMIGGEMDGKEVLTMLFDNKTWSDIDCIDEKDYLPSEAINNSATTIPECMEAFGYVNATMKL